MAVTGFHLVPLLFLAVSSVWEVSAADQTGQISRRERVKIPKNCPPCDVRQCTTLSLTPESCDGRIIKDRCHCCPICVEADADDSHNDTNLAEQTARNQSFSTMPAACNKIECTDYQMCVLNIQGIPMCRCPSSLYCKRQSRHHKVCGGDGVLYKSRCFLQIAECASSTKIGVQTLRACLREKKRKRKSRRKIEKANSKKGLRKPKKPKRLDKKQAERRKNKEKKNKRRKQRRREKRRERRRGRRSKKTKKKSRTAALKATDARRERKKTKRARRKERI